MTTTLIDFKTFKAIKDLREQAKIYRLRIEQMDKVQLLTELLHYNDLYTQKPDDATVTVRAEQLMEVLEQRAELTELRELAQEFQTKLRARLKQQLAL